MAGDGSAYAVLGIDPGADSDEIDQAYRRLIKRHHPDRDGGDAGRAAEINRAYRELRGDRSQIESLELHDDWPATPRQGRFWLLFGLLLALAAAALLMSRSALVPLPQSQSTGPAASRPSRHAKATAQSDPMEQPLNAGAIDAAARNALLLSRTRDEMALASASSDCHRLLRSRPSLLQLDRCAAFDDAVVELEDRDPLRDQGPFSELAVTGRLWSAATELSDDSVAIDGRLDHIRLRVELTLATGSAVEPPKSDGQR